MFKRRTKQCVCCHTKVFKRTKWYFLRKKFKHTSSSNTLGLITAFKGFTESGIDLKYLLLHPTIVQATWSSNQACSWPSVWYLTLHNVSFSVREMLFGKLEVVVTFLFSTSIKEKNAERLLFLCHLLYEAHNPELYKALARSVSLENVRLNFPEGVNLFDSLVIGKFLSHANIHVKCLDLS